MMFRTNLAVLAIAFAAAASTASAQGTPPASGGDAGSVIPEKELPKIMAQAGAAAGKCKGYQAAYSYVSSDAKSDSSGASTGTIYAKKKGEYFTLLLDDPGSGDASTAHKSLIQPDKKLTVLYPTTKTGVETDISKDLTAWRLIGSSIAALSNNFTMKLLNVSGRYAHEKTTYTNLGGDTRKDFKDPAAGKKPSYDSWTCHQFELTPKNGAWASAYKKIHVMVDMNLFIVTRIELDVKGDGGKTTMMSLSEIDIDAKLDEKLFEIDKEYKIEKSEPKKEEKK